MKMKDSQTNDLFFEKLSNKKAATKICRTNVGVIYTRVSSKDQQDNTSLESQKNACEQFCLRKGIRIDSYFGGTYESAKQDDRKEFKKMLDYVKKSGRIDSIIVYSFDRFSRSGPNALLLINELYSKGITVFSSTQETDLSTAAGKLSKDILLIFSQFDNQLRRDKTIRGMVENLRGGFWVGGTPIGYDNVHRKEKTRNHKYVINNEGELLKLAFKWKAEGKMNNVEIVNKLKKLGSSINYKSFTRILSNPFYCGYITHSLLPDAVKGNHPPLISLELFKKVNKELNDQPHKGIPKNGQITFLPLKAFVKDEISLSPFTGYQQKGIYYYKTRAKGTCVNVKAERLNERFKTELLKYSVKEEHTTRLMERVLAKLEDNFSEQISISNAMKKRQGELKGKLENLHESFIERAIEKEVYQNYKAKYQKELSEIAEELQRNSFMSSNLENCIQKGIKLAQNLGGAWDTADFKTKQQIQKLVFPDGMLYKKQNDVLRTERVNTLFILIAEKSTPYKEKNNGDKLDCHHNSHVVVPTGIEPVSKV